MQGRNLLFELGVEEIPSGYLEGAAHALEAAARKVLEAQCRYGFDTLRVFWTPRRFVLFAANLRALAPAVEERVGPLKEAAYQNGTPTAALLGFVRNAGAELADVCVKPTAKGERVMLRLQRKRLPLRAAFEIMARSLTFPKLMRWHRGEQQIPFARPIRWTFARLGTSSLAYRIGRVKSAPYTFGHRFLAPGRARVSSADLRAYQTLLARRHVVLDSLERQRTIERGLKRLGVLRPHPDLVAETRDLVEDPYVVRGCFKKSYLALPSDVLTTCMKTYQKIFAVHASLAGGGIENRFVAVLNGPRPKKALTKIVADYELVLESRLNDAEFFYKEDTKSPLREKVAKLGTIVFLGKLGTLLDKTHRLVALASFLGRHAGLAADRVAFLARAAELSKADLVTHMVYEFPNLQGVMGKEYARAGGEPEQVAEAIAFHYRPLALSEQWAFSVEERQRYEVGALLGFMDRVDTLVGAFGAGLEPSGSEDPYALRRAGGGVAKLIRTFGFSCSLTEVLGKAYDLYETKLAVSRGQVIERLAAFLKDRVAFEVGARPGSRAFEIFTGVCATRFDNLRDVFERYSSLLELAERDKTRFEQTCKVFERTSNILKGSENEAADEVRTDLFRDPLEKSLYDRFQDARTRLAALLEKRDYGTATRTYGEVFYGPLGEFFDRVLVNVEDVALRKNRKALIKQIKDLYGGTVADLSSVTHLSL